MTELLDLPFWAKDVKTLVTGGSCTEQGETAGDGFATSELALAAWIRCPPRQSPPQSPTAPLALVAWIRHRSPLDVALISCHTIPGIPPAFHAFHPVPILPDRYCSPLTHGV